MNKPLFYKCLPARAITLTLLLIAITSLPALAQNKTVTGKVQGDDGSSVVGVSVTVKGTTKGTTTGADGSFTIMAPSNGTLVFSMVGFLTQEASVSAGSFNIKLERDTRTLEQLVVIGYGTAKRKDVTGSVSSVNAATIEKIPVTTVEQALQGRASGVQIVNNDAAPGGNMSVLIRGIGSLAPGGNSPLYVIDGYPTAGGTNNISANDIATIDVLKDASATAIYGIRAANGVVIITTKKGLKNRLQVSLDAYTAFQSKPKEYKLLNAPDFATMSNQVEASDSTHTYHGLPIWHTPNALHSVDWQNAIYQPGLTQNYTIAIRGGNDKVQSAFSLGYYNQKGIVLGSFYKRYTASFNLDYQAASWLKSSTSVKYSHTDASTPFGTGNLFQLAVNPPTLDSGNRLTNQIKDGKGNYGFFNPQNSNVFKFNNPVYSIETQQSQNINNYVLGTTFLEATIIKGLRVKTNFGINTNNYAGSYFQPEDHRAADQYPGSIISNAFYHQSLNNIFEWVWENTLAYDRTFGKHTINFVGGISAQKTTTNKMGAGGIPPNSTIRDLGQLTNLVFDQYGNGEVDETLESQFGRLTYQYNDKYMITGTLRRDGSSKFDKGHQYGVFPSGAVAWRMINEDFMKDITWLSDLKLRASYGEVGNEIPIPLFAFQALYAGNFASNVNGGGADNLGYPFNKAYQNGIAQTQPESPNLKWETDQQLNFGMDAAFMKGALTVTVDYFDRKSKDFLLHIQAPAQSGYQFLNLNVGDMENKGFEFAANYRGNAGKEFHYDIGVTLTTIKNTITDIFSGVKGLPNISNLGIAGQGWDQFTFSAPGGPVGEFYGYKSLGVFQTKAQIDALNSKAPGGIYYRAATSPGDRYFADMNGDGLVNADDRVAIGNPQPKFYGGLNFDGSYKAWDFNLYFYGSFGNKIMNYVESDLESFQKRGSEGVENVSQKYFQNYWMPNRPSNRYSRALAVDDNTLNSVPSSVWVEDGSYVKLKNLVIGYTLPASIASKVALTKLRVYFSTQNLFFITKYSGLDPEIGIQGANATTNGIDNGTYPSSKFFTFGLNATF